MKFTTYDTYINILNNGGHILIGGATGSGKSVILNNLIYTSILINHENIGFFLLDPKLVELNDYKHITQALAYADTPERCKNALYDALTLINSRYKQMQRDHIKTYTGGPVYIVIDELADLLTSEHKKETALYLQRILQIGRAARVHVIACTQSIHHSILPTYIKINFNTIIALKVRNKKDSNLLIDMRGAESLPQYGEMIILYNSTYEHCTAPLIPNESIAALIEINTKK